MPKHRLAFSKADTAKYISHLDLMRTFQRAFLRAGLPIKHTEGFNPHAFVSIPLPLSVGYSSACEVLECELLLIAAGFLGAQKYVSDAFGLELTPRACVKTQADGYAAGAGKIFAAGDMRRGQSLVVWAIREGRGAARAVDEYLMGYTNLP